MKQSVKNQISWDATTSKQLLEKVDDRLFASQLEQLSKKRIKKITEKLIPHTSFTIEILINNELFIGNFKDALTQGISHIPDRNVSISTENGFTYLSIKFSKGNDSYLNTIDTLYELCEQHYLKPNAEMPSFSDTESSTINLTELSYVELSKLFEITMPEDLEITFSLKTKKLSLGEIILSSMKEQYSKNNTLRITCNKEIAYCALSTLKLTEESFKCVAAKPISELLIPREYRTSLAETTANGGYYVFNLTERKPFPIYTMLLVGGIAAIEIAVGAALVACLAPTAYGALVGIGLITDGVMDIFTLGQTAYNRQLNVKWFLIGKGVSIGLIFATAAISQAIAAKRAAHVARTAAKAAETSTDVVQASAQQVAARTTENAVGRASASVVQHTSRTATIIGQEITRRAVPKMAAMAVSTAADILIPARLTYMQNQLRDDIAKQYDRFIKFHEAKIVRIFNVTAALGKAELQALVTRLLSETSSVINFFSGDSIHGHLAMLTNIEQQTSSLLFNEISSIVDRYFYHCTFQESFSKYLSYTSTTYEPDNLDLIKKILKDKYGVIEESGHIVIENISCENLKALKEESFGNYREKIYDFLRYSPQKRALIIMINLNCCKKKFKIGS